MSMHRLLHRTALAGAAAFLAIGSGTPPARANDTIAVLGAGGLQIAVTQYIEMEREDLFVSPSKVNVDYVFRNTAGEDIETLVAFPMPDISSYDNGMEGIADPTNENFMDFKVTQDGKPVETNIQQRAIVNGLDVTADLEAQDVPVFVLGKDGLDAVQALPEDVLADWEVRGIVVKNYEGVDDGQEAPLVPNWKIRTTYWWRTTFRADGPTKVHHTYKPSVGGISGLNFMNGEGKADYEQEKYRQKYCINDKFNAMVSDRVQETQGVEGIYYFERWLSYILVTGANWAGPIGDFHLTVDKEDPDALVSFCSDGVRKTGPTTFEMTKENFVPERDLDILIVYKSDQRQQ